jgi:hypothetical protein
MVTRSVALAISEPKRASLARTRSSARLRSLTSTITPCQQVGAPAASRTSTASSRTQTHRPSAARTRYSQRNGSPFWLDRASSAANRSRSSGCTTRIQKPGSVR